MPRGRRRKIEVPTDSQPQFELGDTAEDIEKRRKERERERQEQEERGQKGPRRWKRLGKEQKSDLKQNQILIQNQHNPGKRRDK